MYSLDSPLRSQDCRGGSVFLAPSPPRGRFLAFGGRFLRSVGCNQRTSTHFRYYRAEHILSDAKSALRENAKMQTRADEPLKVRLRKAIFTCLYLFYLGTRKGTTRTRARRALVKLSILDPRTCTVVSRQWALVSTSSSASDVGSSSLPSGTCEDLFGKSRSNCVAASACSSSCACAHDVVKVHLENR